MKYLSVMVGFVLLCSFSGTIANEKLLVGFRIKNMGFWVDGNLPVKAGDVIIDQQLPENSKINFLIDVHGLRTGIKERDAELLKQEWFDAKDHPNISFESYEIQKISGNQLQVNGTLTIKGQSRQISVPVKLSEKNDVTYISAKVSINRLDFGVGKKVMGMSDEVEVSVYLPSDPLPTTSMYTGK